MLHWIINYFLCSAILLGFYQLVIERMAWFRFNRIYLLVTLMLPLVLPFVETKLETALHPAVSQVWHSGEIMIAEAITPVPPDDTVAAPTVMRDTGVPLHDVLCIGSVIITICLFIRFINNLAAVRKKGKMGLTGDGIRICASRHVTYPYTFWRTIYVNRDDWENGIVDPVIVAHESVHARQLHSADIVVVEFMRVLLWFNPLMLLLRRAISLNHEYLADAGVVGGEDPAAYQYVLLGKRGEPSRRFASSFNYLSIRKRIIMLNKKSTPLHRVVTALVTTPVIAVCCLLFTSRPVIAMFPALPVVQHMLPGQDTVPRKDSSPGTVIGFTIPPGPGANDAEILEFRNLLSRATIAGRENAELHKRYDNGLLTREENTRLGELFTRMNTVQRDQFGILMAGNSGALKRVVPTPAQFEAYKNPAVYGVWIDGKKVSNSDLAKYSNTDFAQVMVSKLYGAAKKGRAYTHQLNMMTNKGYEQYLEDRKKEYPYVMMFRFRKPAKTTP